MDAITFSRAKKNLAKTMQQSCDDHEPVIITRKNEPAIVMLSLEDYQSIKETAYLLHSPKNAKRLFKSIAELNAGKSIEKELIE
ncbi:type II toxin-antitoxin system prevent-host-death family antitoxin [Candidatus Halobeggiatoa sp. HSG11]|nr:type II toxin-antitoxin system prevent-host-death family antitoxin [Candidatus Halobeggiatoa sp. HSG11]